MSIASLYCCQIHYSNNGKTYFAIGFKNDSLGYELRSKYFKGSCSPKQITSICSGQSTAMVFEGFMDFLSFLSLPAGLSRFPADYFILNSVSLVKNVLQVLKSYRRIMTFLDNDAAGENCSQELQQRFKEKMLNLSYLFSPYKDLNDFLCSQAPSKEIPLQIPEPP
ncbi:toprim domain-containing protein [Brevundimonas sp.]|uniref:toprim domain-containing protein n=1 Tax=Brevundimonas sp. TaxID=1871086 RepID=UPI0025C36F07|nr:toprim domain-containing protein [Brevundimonas sp.]